MSFIERCPVPGEPRAVGWMLCPRQKPHEQPRRGTLPETCLLHVNVAICRSRVPNRLRASRRPPHGSVTRHDREPTCDQHVLSS